MAAAVVDLSPAEDLARGGLRRAMKVGVNRAASPVKASVVSHAEAIRLTGATAKSIRIRVRDYPADRYVAVIGPSVAYVRVKRKRRKRGATPGAGVFIKPAKYAHLVERGTARSKARPFLGPAHAATVPRFLAVVGQAIGAEVERELARRAARPAAKGK